MTDNEKKAREILDIGFRANIPDDLIWLIEKQGGELPELTDRECIDIAVNFPASFQGIRNTFPRVKL